ncbi:MAG TPA: hypothetical protein VF727_03555 [Allosphingosinicella sp.]
MNVVGVGGIAGALFFSGWYIWPEHRPVYDLSIETAQARLQGMGFEEGILAHVPVTVAAERTQVGRSVHWSFGGTGSGFRASSCTVALDPIAPARTGARLSCAVDNADPVIASRAAALLELVVGEHASAALTGRPFDRSRMGHKFIAFGAAEAVSRTR